MHTQSTAPFRSTSLDPRCWTAIVALVFALTTVVKTTAQVPPQMTRIVYRSSGPTIAADSADAQPITIYRGGAKYERIEHAPDPGNQRHALEITSEPDSWFVNLADHTAVHMLDQGPQFTVHHYIVSLPSGQPDPAFLKLEFGREANFVRQPEAKETGMRKIDNKDAKVFIAKGGDREVTLFVDPITAKPLRIDITKNGKPEISVAYLEYETGLPFDPPLFQLPEGIKVTEAK